MIQDRYVINDIGGFFTKTSGVKMKKRKIIIMECAFWLHTTKNISPSPMLQIGSICYIDVDQGSLINKKIELERFSAFAVCTWECLVYGRMFVTRSVCVWLLLVMLRVCWLSVLVGGWCSKGCRLWLFGLDPTGTLMSAVLPSIFSWLASRLFVVSGWIVLLTYRDGSSKLLYYCLIVCLID